MKCGKCGNKELSVAAGTATCGNCGESLPNEVVDALRAGLGPKEYADGPT